MESKFLDCGFNIVTINQSTDGSAGEIQPSSGCTGALSVPAQGDGESQRDGRKYTVTSCYVSGIIGTVTLVDQADVIEHDGYFLALVMDTQVNAATIVSENVYINPSTSSLAMLPYPLRNLQNSKRFRILDSVYIRPGGGYAGTDGTNTLSVVNQTAPMFKLSWHGKMNVECKGTTADVASVTNNAIHLLAYTGTNTLGAVVIGKSRIRFVG